MNVKQFYLDTKSNYENALAIMMNDLFIEKMLTKFIDNNAYEQLISFYDKKDYSSLFAAAHTYKGVTGNLALTPLYEIASYITEATRHSDDVNLDDKIQELKDQYKLVKDKYYEYLNK